MTSSRLRESDRACHHEHSPNGRSTIAGEIAYDRDRTNRSKPNTAPVAERYLPAAQVIVDSARREHLSELNSASSVSAGGEGHRAGALQL